MDNHATIRKIDELGRVVLPKECREKLGWNEKTSLQIEVVGDQIHLSRYNGVCCICGSDEVAGCVTLNSKKICQACAAKLANGGNVNNG